MKQRKFLGKNDQRSMVTFAKQNLWKHENSQIDQPGFENISPTKLTVIRMTKLNIY